jgi:flavodoxin
MRKLVVYYSFSGATQLLAAEIARQTGADLRALIPKTPYDFGRNTAVRELRSEIGRGFCPELASGGESVEPYDAVFIGSPNWLNRLAPPVLSFLRRADLSGKAVIPFCTSGSGGFGRMIEDFQRECPASKLLPGFAAEAGFAPSEVSKWLRGIGLQGESIEGEEST